MAKILCVLYEDPVGGYPTTYARDDLPAIDHYPGGQTVPSPTAIDFTPGHLLGSVSGALGLRQYLEAAGHTLVVTSDKEGPDSVFDRELADADVVISQPSGRPTSPPSASPGPRSSDWPSPPASARTTSTSTPPSPPASPWPK